MRAVSKAAKNERQAVTRYRRRWVEAVCRERTVMRQQVTAAKTAAPRKMLGMHQAAAMRKSSSRSMRMMEAAMEGAATGSGAAGGAGAGAAGGAGMAGWAGAVGGAGASGGAEAGGTGGKAVARSWLRRSMAV